MKSPAVGLRVLSFAGVRPALACIAAFALVGVTVRAATNLTWDTSGSAGIQTAAGTWNNLTTSNWTSNGGTSNVQWDNANLDNAIFTTTGSAYTVTLATVSAHDVSFAGSGTGVITLASSALTFDGAITVASGNAVSIGSQLTGTGSITSSGALTFANGSAVTPNNFTGGVTLNAGSVTTLGGSNLNASFGTGTLTINGGTINQNLFTSGFDVSNPIVIGGDFAINSQGGNGFFSGTVNLGGATRTFTNNGSGGSGLNGVISNGGLIIAGSGGTGLSNTGGTFAGGVTLSAGSRLGLNGASSGPAGAPTAGPIGTGTLTINGGTLSAGNGTVVILGNNIVINNDFSLFFNGYTYAGAVDLGGGNRTFTMTGTNGGTFSGAVSNGGITLGGSSAGLTLNNVNSTFSGGVTVGPANTLTITNSSVGTVGAITSGPLGTGTFTINGGSLSVSNSTNILNSIVVNADFNISGGSSGVVLQGAMDLGGSIRAVNVNSSFSSTTINLNNVISGTGGFTFTNTSASGAGPYVSTVAFGGTSANTYTGLTTLAGVTTANNSTATLSLNKTAGVNAIAGDLLITGGKVSYVSSNQIANTSAVTVNGSLAIFDLGASHTDTVGAVTLDGGGSITGTGTSALTGSSYAMKSGSVTAILAGSGVALTKTTGGTVTLSGANTYTGATTVNGGTLVADTTTNAAVLSSSSGLVLGGGTFQLKGKAATVRAQTLNGLTVNPGSGVVDANNLGTSTTLTLGGITRNSGGTVDFKASTGTFGTDAVVNSTASNDASGILGAWATVNGGADFAANNGSNKIVAYTGYTDIAATGSTIADGTTTNVRLNSAGGGGNASIGVTTNINTLMQNTATASTVDTTAGTLRVGTAGGIFITPTGAALTVGTAADAGILTAGGNAADVAGELILGNSSANTLTINSTVTNNGAGSVGLTKTGTGLAVLNGANTYTGATYINSGTLNAGVADVASTSGALGNGGTITFGGGTLQYSAASASTDYSSRITGSTGAISVDTNGQNAGFASALAASNSGGLTKSGAGTLTLSGANAYTGATTVNAGTLKAGVASVANTSGAFGNNSAVTLANTAGVTLDITGFNTQIGSLTGGGATGGNVTLGSATLTTGGDNTSPAAYAGVISGSGGGLTKIGTGTQILSGSNTYTGATTVTTGTLKAGVATVGGASPTSGAFGVNSTTTVATGATLDLAGFTQTLGSIAGGGKITSSAAGTPVLTIGGDNSSPIFSGIIQNGVATSVALTKIGTGTQILTGANIFTGATTISAGTLQLGNGGTTGSLSVAGTITNNGTLIINRSNAVVQGIDFSTAALATGTGNFIQAGTGSTTLYGLNAYTGTTTVSAGTLIAGYNVTSATASAFGNASSAIVLGDANTTANNSSASLLTGNSQVIIGRAVTIANQATSGTYMIGGNTAYVSSFTGAITANQSFTVSQVSGGTLNISGNIGSGNATAKTVTFGNAGAVNVTSIISNASGTFALTQSGTGTTTLSGVNTYTGATTVSGGILALSSAGRISNSSALTVNGGNFRNNSSTNYAGTFSFTTGTISGTNWNGSLSGLTIGTGQTISPGNSPGTAVTGSQTWAGGGTYEFEVNNFTGTAGADPGWDLLSTTGNLSITATSGSQFTIKLVSLGLDNLAGLATNFTNTSNYSLQLTSVTGSLTGFAANAFTVDASAFANTIAAGGAWAVTSDGSNLFLSYTAVPEPSTGAAIIGVLVLAGAALRRRRRS